MASQPTPPKKFNFLSPGRDWRGEKLTKKYSSNVGKPLEPGPTRSEPFPSGEGATNVGHQKRSSRDRQGSVDFWLKKSSRVVRRFRRAAG